jgi:hypothetical protein
MRNPCDKDVADNAFERMQATTTQFISIIQVTGEECQFFEYLLKSRVMVHVDIRITRGHGKPRSGTKRRWVGCNRVKNAWELRL